MCDSPSSFSRRSSVRTDPPILEAAVWQRAEGTWGYDAKFTGQMDVNLLHRITAVTDEEVEVGGKKTAAFCII